MLQTDRSILTATMPEEKEYDLQNPQHLLDFLIDANIRLVRREYLFFLEKEKRLWPRRQEAERESFQAKDGSLKAALLTIEEYKKLLIDVDGYVLEEKRCCIFSVSHCWEAKHHPDPFGFQARELLPNIVDCGLWSPMVFIDFICLPQYYRTAEEHVFFQRAMANMHLLYAHQFVHRVVRLENLADENAKRSPPDFIDIYFEEEGAEPGSGKFGPQPFNKLELNGTPYHERGWCEAEKQWMSTKEIIKGFAPMAPAKFRERVDRGHRNFPDGLVLKFTHRSDEEIVVKLQEKIFLLQAPKRKELKAWTLPESELLILADSLPHFVNVRFLEFWNLEIHEGAAMALIAGLRPLRQLRRLDFLCSCTEDAARVLANGLLECHFVEELVVSGTEKLAIELRLLKRTERVFERNHSSFTIKPAAGVEGLRFGWLGQQLEKFTTCCKRRARDYQPHVTLDDAHV